MMQFLIDLALIPALWRRAVEQERARRYRASPEGQAAFEDEVIAAHKQDPKRVERMKATAPSGRFDGLSPDELVGALGNSDRARPQ